MAKKTPKKNAKKTGRQTIQPAVVQGIMVEIMDGVNIHDEETLKEALSLVREAQAKQAQINKFIEITRNQATTYMNSHNTKVVQLDGHYWRLIQRFSRFFVATDADMPDPAPKGAKSLKALCQGKKVGKKDTPLWNFITKRVVDPTKVDEAVSKGYLKQKDVDKAYLESAQKPFVQPFTGEAVDGEDE